jgi:transcriptional regulator with XRE-family HTH domain
MTEQEYIYVVCNNIKQQRIKKGFKQIEFACEIGIDDSSLRRIESGRTSPTLKTLIRISKALGVKVTELLPDEIAE